MSLSLSCLEHPGPRADHTPDVVDTVVADRRAGHDAQGSYGVHTTGVSRSGRFCQPPSVQIVARIFLRL